MLNILLVLLVSSVAGSSKLQATSDLLGNPRQLASLYRDYALLNHKEISQERLLIFRDNIAKIVEGNKHATTWSLGINQFTDMSSEERKSYLGLNMTRQPELSVVDSDEPVSLVGIPTSWDWRVQGKVTGAKNQGSCGSCYTFGAVGVVETNYAIRSGKRKDFAEKEYLDCTYSGGRNGCNGGWSEECWEYSARVGRLALTRDAAYKAKDERCGLKYKRMHNGLVSSVITGVKKIYGFGQEAAFIRALSERAVVVGFEATDYFMNYQDGVIADPTCDDWGSSTANHAVTAVGYTPNSLIIKNSWGSSWGMGGYFETVRGVEDCEYFRWGAWPIWKDTGKTDTDPEYVPVEEEDCNGKNADGCACGTVRCSDGVCRHAHMC